MGQSRPVVVTFRGEKNLCLVLQAPERLAVQDPVTVTLIGRADIAERFLPVTPQRLTA